MLKNLGMEKCKSAKVPMDSGTEMVKNRYMGEDYEATKEEIQGYQSYVGILLLLAYMTRPNISFAVEKCGRNASNPTLSHDVALKGLFDTLKGLRSWASDTVYASKTKMENYLAIQMPRTETVLIHVARLPHTSICY